MNQFELESLERDATNYFTHCTPNDFAAAGQRLDAFSVGENVIEKIQFVMLNTSNAFMLVFVAKTLIKICVEHWAVFPEEQKASIKSTISDFFTGRSLELVELAYSQPTANGQIPALVTSLQIVCELNAKVNKMSWTLDKEDCNIENIIQFFEG
ncbi:MAG: hypothetical protein EZS28_022734 [Streblomastix strix]|uniref:Uncharacterized protein n=1 Tax=Streblomastix strix TaxID=222440 RepID=A0A5J4VGN2_9EUKA|nr:MAG: hypothetical protein EZS28_022734 [Streblomastix strix]